jgi:transcriptional regulator with XRE-family HTH domain
MAQRKVSPVPAAADALAVLGAQIRERRHARRWTAEELAARVGVSPRTILAVEAGYPGTAAGTVMNAAVMVGVPLFGAQSRDELAQLARTHEDRVALLPTRTYHLRSEDDDDTNF